MGVGSYTNVKGRIENMSKKVKRNYDNGYVYIRKYDLTKYDYDTLNKYGLDKKQYIYIGSTVDLKARISKFRYQMLDQVNLKNKNSVRYINNDVSVFYNNFYHFCLNELNIDDSQFREEKFKYDETIQVPYVEYVNMNKKNKNDEYTTIKLHELLEMQTIVQYQSYILINKKLGKHTIELLSDNDSVAQYFRNELGSGLDFIKDYPIIPFTENILTDTDLINGTFNYQKYEIPTKLQTILEGFYKQTLSDIAKYDIIEQE